METVLCISHSSSSGCISLCGFIMIEYIRICLGEEMVGNCIGEATDMIDDWVDADLQYRPLTVKA